MEGKHGDAIESRSNKPGVALHRLGVSTMQLRTLARQEILVNRRPRQRVTEAVAASAGVNDEKLVLDRLAQG